MRTRPPFLIAAVLLAAAPLAAGELTDLRIQDAEAQTAPPAPPAVPAAASGAAAQEEAADLTGQFIDACTRAQGGVGSCHAFGSVAVLEAAYYRKYKQKIRFSEADLFIRRTVLSKELYADICAGKECKLKEGNDAIGDIRFALDNGVATGLGYDQFIERYTKYRWAEEETLRGIIANHEKESWLVKLLYDPRKHWAELQDRPQNKRITEMFLAGRDPAIDAERAANKAKLAGFKAREKEFPYLGDKVAGAAAERKKAGLAQGQTVMSELKAGRPVAVSMTLKGLDAWGQKGAKEHANHCFLIVGFRQKPGQEAVFQTRNSWGGDNPEVHEDELLRIFRAVTVLTPEEAASSK